MAKIIKCDCGFIVKGETDEELVVAGKKHAREVHGMEPTAEQLLSLASVAD